MLKSDSFLNIPKENLAAIRSKPHHVHLLIYTVILTLFGVLMVYSSSALYAERILDNALYFTVRHTVHVILGAFLFFVASMIDYRYYRRWVVLLMLISFFSLLLVLIPGIGIKTMGARRWINLIVFTYQPADFFKLAVMIWIADFMIRKREHVSHFTRALVPPLLVMMIFVLLLLLQPDFGSAVLVLVSLLMVTLIAGARVSHLIFILFCAGTAFILLAINSAYRFRRIKAFMDPWGDTGDVSYQLSNSLIAYGGGGFFGRGLGNSLQKEFYLPQSHTDFISAVIAEEIGLLGLGIFLAFFTLFIMKGLAISIRCKDEFGRNLSFGLTMIIALQGLFHICVTMGLLPTKGIGLPLISYGGSSTATTLAMLGILYNIGKNSDTPFTGQKFFNASTPKFNIAAPKPKKAPVSDKKKYFMKRVK